MIRYLKAACSVAQLGAVAAVVYGVQMISVPAAWLVGGVLVAVVAESVDRSLA